MRREAAAFRCVSVSSGLLESILNFPCLGIHFRKLVQSNIRPVYPVWRLIGGAVLPQILLVSSGWRRMSRPPIGQEIDAPEPRANSRRNSGLGVRIRKGIGVQEEPATVQSAPGRCGFTQDFHGPLRRGRSHKLADAASTVVRYPTHVSCSLTSDLTGAHEASARSARLDLCVRVEGLVRRRPPHRALGL